MKILWAKTDFLHPTNRGGQIRTLEMVKRLHARHEVHYVAYDDPSSPEGRERACEYSSRSFPVARPIPPRGSPRFIAQLLTNLLSPLPLAVGRYRSAAMRRKIAALDAEHHYDVLLADFLSSAPNFPQLERCVLFQHNVESAIWNRHAQHAASPARRIYFRSQARRMASYEGSVCRAVRQVISVSPQDSQTMRELFGVERVTDVATGVDVEYFRRPKGFAAPREQLVFVGAMDWMPNIEGAQWFVSEVLPLLRAERPSLRVVLAGRNPSPDVRKLAASDALIDVTGTVPDIRPYLWDSAVSIVPLRIGGGTRLKIYEAMAAGTSVVSTGIGAEGLTCCNGRDIILVDEPARFAAAVLKLLSDLAERQCMATHALNLVSNHFSWDAVTARFESILEAQCQ